jgi:competence ComEA-like helix-hairpin-helix protein
MIVTSPVRRSDQPLQIGSRHGYRIDGDSAFINAELSVPPYHPGGAWALELWACDRAYEGGELSGVKVSEVLFDVPTPIAPHIHKVEALAAARLPLQGVAHTMLLALVEGSGAERCVHDVASYPALETFPAPHFEGDVGYELRGHEVILQAAAVANPRPEGNLSGTLSIELWASPIDSNEAPEAERGHCLAQAQLAPVAGGESAFGLGCRAAFSEPPPGTFRLELLLREWTRELGYLTRDRRAFDLYYQQAPLVQADEEEELVWESTVAAAEPVAVLPEPVVAAKPAVVAPEPVVAAKPAVLEPEPVVVAAKAVVVPEAVVVAPEPVVVAAKPAVVVVPEPAVVAAKPAVAKPVLPPPPVALASAPAAVPSAAVPSAAAAVPAVAPAAAVPAAAPAARSNTRVSIQTASVEELSRVKGLNLKVAKEIVKSRPFATLDDLVKVQGIGRKTFDKIRSFVTL